MTGSSTVGVAGEVGRGWWPGLALWGAAGGGRGRLVPGLGLLGRQGGQEEDSDWV